MRFQTYNRLIDGYWVNVCQMLNTHRWSIWIETPTGEHIFTTADAYVPAQKRAADLVREHRGESPLPPEGATPNE